MSTRTRNGWMDELRDFATAIVERLSELAEVARRDVTLDEYVYFRKVLIVPAADTAIEDYLRPPPGTIWLVERVTITDDINGSFGMYLDEAQPQNLIDGEFSNSQAMATWERKSYIPSGSTLVLRFFAQPNNKVCTVNLRITEIRPNE